MITYGSTTLTSYNTITKIEVYYYKSTSATSLSGGSWSTTKPTWENGKYIWQKIRTTYEGKLENGQYYSESDPVNITGQQGQQGETGASAYSYKLNVSDTIISVSKNGTYSTNSVTFSATSKQGNEDINPYEGRFKIETTMDGITWTTQYTSSANESSKTFTIPSDISNIRCSLYQAGGTTVLLDITSVSIVRDGIDGALYPNLSPFFSHDLTDVYNAETNPNGYWIEYSSYGWTKNSNFTFTQLEDGWLHVHIDNSSGTSVIRNDCCIPRYNPSIKKGTMYTFLTEFRNNQSTGLDETSNFYLVQQSGGVSVQFWGINTTTAPSKKLEGIGGVSIRVIDIPSDGSYAIARGTKYSESEDSASHWTTEDAMVTFTFRANAGAVIDYDIRLSVYEGEYWGNYVPYIISDVTDIRNSAETANNRAEEANNKIDNLEIGGRNLLRNTEKITADKLALSRASVPENGIIRITPTGSAGYCKFCVDYLDYINYEGITFTASMDVRIADIESAYTTTNNLIVYFGVNIASRINSIFTSSYDRYSSKTFTGLTSQWQRFSFSFTIPDDLKTGKTSALVEGSQITIQISEGGSRSPIDVRLVKLEKGNKPTDWTPAPEDVEEEIVTLRTDLQSQIDEKIQTYYQSTNPASSWTTTELRTSHDGDLWYYTGTTTSTYTKDNVYRYNASNNTWSVYSASGELFDKVDGKSTIYYGTTLDDYTGVETGDYLVDSTDGSSYRWDGNEWVKVTDYKTTITNAIDDIEIGGRNLIIGTLNPDARGGGIYRPHLPGQITNTAGRGTCTVAEHGLRFTNTTANWEYIYFGASANSAEPCMLGLEAGQTYTLSADLSWKILSSDTGKANTTTYGMGAMLAYSSEANLNDFVTAVSDYPLLITQADKGTDMSGRLTFTFTVPSDAIRLYLGIRANNTTASHYAIGDYLEARNMKLEKGSKATDWSPAPEDMQDGIDTALAQANTALEQSVEYIVGTQTATTGTWTGVTTDNELKIGKTIAYKLPYAGSGNASLVLTLANGSTTDAIPVYLNTTRVTTHFGANSVINMTYDGQYWRASSIPNTNNYDRRQHSNAITAKTAITAKHLIVGDSTGYQQITSTSGGTLEFNLGYPILWAYSDIAATKTSTATYEAYPSVNFSTSGTIQDGAANKMLWLKGTIRGNIFTLASTNFLTTRIPTSDDGMYYIPLGIMSSATTGYFSSSNRIYAYIDEEFQPLDNAATLKATSAYETAVQARSEIVQTQQTLSLQIRDISVGGANLFEKTKTFEGTANQSTAHDSFTEFVYKDLTVKSANTITFGNQIVELSAYQYTDLTSNMWYSFSFYAKGNVDIGFMYAGTGNAVIDSIDVSWDDNTYTGFNTTSTSSNIIWLTPTNNWQRYSVVFHIEEQDITALHRLIGLYARSVSSYTELATDNKDILITETGTDAHLIMEGNEVQICGYKLELGNKPTDWTPADNDKATYDNIISQINLSKEGIAIRADKIRLEGMITANEGFSIDEYGNMTANNGKFNGLFESYATEINENTFDIKITNGHIHLLNNEDRTLSDSERHVGYIGGGRNKVTYVDGTNKNNDAIDIRLDNGNDFMISAHKDWGNSILYRITNHPSGGFSADYWCNLHMYDGNRIQMYGYKDNQNPQIEFYRYSKNTSGYLLRGLLSLHSVTDNNSEFSDRLYLWAKNQGNDLVGDQWLHFTGKGLKYTSGNQPLRTGYVATDKYIVTQYFSLPDLTIVKNTSQNFTIDVSRDGYTPIMCIPKVGGGQNAFYLSIYTWSMSGNIVTIRTHNNSSTSDVSNVTISLQVLYKLTY